MVEEYRVWKAADQSYVLDRHCTRGLSSWGLASVLLLAGLSLSSWPAVGCSVSYKTIAKCIFGGEKLLLLSHLAFFSWDFLVTGISLAFGCRGVVVRACVCCAVAVEEWKDFY